MVPGAEAAGWLDLDDQGVPCRASIRPIPWRRHDDPPDANRRQVGLGASGPVVIFDFRLLQQMIDGVFSFWIKELPGIYALAGMVAVVLIIRPLILLVDIAIRHNALIPGATSLIRWQAHWHVVRQNWSFFQNDFAGRIAQRVMTTANALRESVMASIRAVCTRSVESACTRR